MLYSRAGLGDNQDGGIYCTCTSIYAKTVYFVLCVRKYRGIDIIGGGTFSGKSRMTEFCKMVV
jgi:hypothetical protein